MGKLLLFKSGTGIVHLLLIALVMSVTPWVVPAQETVINYSDALNDPGFVLQSEDQGGVNITFSIDKFSFTEALIKGNTLKTIQLSGNFLPNNFGAPDLPGGGKYIAIPSGATATLTINSVRTESFTNIDMASAPRIPKVNETGPVDYQKDMSIYSQNAFYPVKPVSLSAPMKIRGVDVVMLGITPFQYNPVTKELIVYRDIDVEVSFSGGNGQFGEDRLRSRWWDAILKDAVFNSGSLPAIQYSPKAAKSDSIDLEYIIISPDDPAFVQWADTIRVWRARQGIKTGVVTLSTIGGNSTNLIENYINHAYNNWSIPPSAILFLGDYGTTGNDCIISPVWNSYCISDNIYADVDGDDLPDISTARITARNAAELQHMIGKFLDYERNPPVNPNFYDNPITAMGWQTERWFQLCSEIVNGFWEYGLGKNPVRENAIYSGTPGGAWSTNTNTPTIVNYFGTAGLNYIPDNTAHLTDWGGDATRVNNSINSGAFMLQHRDHGGVTGWGEPAYSNSDLAGLTNSDLSYILSINCLTGKFNDGNECFAEAFHRHQDGALGILAATEISYSFVNDTYVWGLFDDMWPGFMPAYGAPPGHSDNILPAFANSAAKYFLQQSSWPYNPGNKEVTYFLFHHHGDAFSTVYSEIPQYLTVVHNPILYSGVNFFTVSADTGALISLTVNDEIIGLDYGTGSPVNIPIIAQMPGNQMLVTVTKQNYYRYTMMVQVIPPFGPFVSYSSHVVDDISGGNANGMVEFGELIDLSLAVVNLGVQTATNVNVTISTSDANVYIIDSTEFYGNINPGDTSFISDGFSFGVNTLIPDNHTVVFNVVAVGDSVWTSTFTETIYAPVIEIANMTVLDVTGNNNGRLDPGETADIIISAKNTGHSDAANSIGILSSTHPDITVNTPMLNLGTIAAGNTANATYNITVDPSCSIGTVVDLVYFVYSGPYADQKTFYPSIGLIVEDWETGGFSNFNWNFSGNAPWVIDNVNQYEGNYCSRSGIIGDNNSSILHVTLEVLTDDSISFFRKVSSESGYDFLKFYIDNIQQGQWAGEEAWQKFSYPVTAGLHTFKWEYYKDVSVSSGDDCAWVDFIEFPPVKMPALDAGVIAIHNIPGQSGLQDIRVDIKNFGTNTLVSAFIEWEVDGNPGGGYLWNGSLPKDGIDGPLTIGSYNFTGGWHNIRAWTTNPNGGLDELNSNDTSETDMYFISPINSFPYCESFENGIGLWQQPANDDFDWTRLSGATQSATTGPSSAYDGTYYIYTESSSPRVDGDEAFFIADFDFSLLNYPELTFYYHMWGGGIGTLHVDVYDAGWHLDVWSLSGDQGNNWSQAIVNLSAYAHKADITIRFRGELGNGVGNTWHSDIAIDLVCVNNNPLVALTTTITPDTSICEDYTLNLFANVVGAGTPFSYLWNDGNTTPSIMVAPQVTTTFSVTATDIYGTTASDDVTITVYPLPQITQQPVNASVKMGGTITFDIQANGATSYQWQLTTNNGLTWTDLLNNITYAGVDTDILAIANALISMDGYYYRCRVTNTHGCFDYSDAGGLFVIPVATIVTEAASYYGCIGTVVVPITITDFTDVASLTLTLDYDTSQFIYAGWQNLHTALANGFLTVNPNLGKITISWFDPFSNVSFGNGTLMELVFTANAGASFLNWDTGIPGACHYSDIAGYIIPDSYINGTINTFSCSSIAGELTYDNQDSTALNDTKLYAYNLIGFTQDSTISNGYGGYYFPTLPIGSYSIVANPDKLWGGVNANDALMIMRHFAGLITLTDLPLAVADVDASGFINTLDALMCAQRFVGMIASFPSGDWGQEIDTLLVNGNTPVIYNFQSLCFGDVNCSHLPTTVKQEPLLILEQRDITKIDVNENIVIPLSVNKAMDINAISLILSYPVELLNFVEIDLRADHGVLQYNDVGGEIRISWYSTTSIEIKESNVLLDIVFSPKRFDISGIGNSFLTLHPQSELADQEAKTIYNAKLFMPEIISTEESSGEFYLGQNYPNPFNNNTEIEYALVEAGKVSLDVYNTLGEKVDNIISDKLLNKGSYLVSFDASLLPAGMYYYRMNFDSKSGSTSKTRIMIIVTDN